MKDLSVLVVEQGELLDKIDYNINKASDSVQAGYKELTKAEETQKKARGGKRGGEGARGVRLN